MKAIGRKGKTVVTHHNEPEAIILSVAEYGDILRALHEVEAKHESVLDTLRQRFDERMASLQSTDSGARLRGVMHGPAKLSGKVKAGAPR